MGALLTYYLREDAPSGTKVVLSVADATGRQMRQLDAVAKAGLHLTPWDLREAAVQVQGGRGATLTRPPTSEGGDETPLLFPLLPAVAAEVSDSADRW